MIQVAMMASDTRPEIFSAAVGRLISPAGGALHSAPLARPPRMYFAGAQPPRITGWDVVAIKKGKPYLPQFWRVLLEADARHDLLFLEDDIWCAEDAVPLMASLELPEWAGAVSFFDFRNDQPPAGFFAMPKGRPLWGTQAIRIPARRLAQMQTMIRAGNTLGDINSWDGWLGRACEWIGTRVALFAPSLVQHLGTVTSAISPLDHYRPHARNFLEPWPVVDARADVYWCHFHATRHDAPSICPRIDR
jgi:hypothetical protein